MGMVFGRIAEELPRHSIVSKHATYQIRRYEPSIAVQCDYSRGWGNSSDGTPFGSGRTVHRRIQRAGEREAAADRNDSTSADRCRHREAHDDVFIAGVKILFYRRRAKAVQRKPRSDSNPALNSPVSNPAFEPSCATAKRAIADAAGAAAGGTHV